MSPPLPRSFLNNGYVGNARWRYATEETFVETVFPGMYRREVFARIGTFEVAGVPEQVVGRDGGVEAVLPEEHVVEPVAAGLDFLCQGIRRISPDDHTALERGRMLYDALYAQLSVEDQR